jgi:hypothetical protein
MKKIVLAVLVLVTFSLGVYALPSTIVKSGNCKLQKAGPFDKKKVFSVNLKNADAAVSCKFRGGDFFRKFMLFAIPQVTNLSGKPFRISYNVAFFDNKNNLVACVSQSWDNIEANANGFTLGSAMVQIPQEKFNDISSYKLVIYISKKK